MTRREYVATYVMVVLLTVAAFVLGVGVGYDGLDGLRLTAYSRCVERAEDYSLRNLSPEWAESVIRESHTVCFAEHYGDKDRR